MDELTKEFIAESIEGLDRMDRCLTELELRPKDAELLGEIFRAVHTIKGTTGFLGFGRLEKLAHAGESLLGSLRDGRLSVSPELVGLLLNLMDGLRAILRLIETTGGEGERADDDDTELIAAMAQMNRTVPDGRASEGVRLVLEGKPAAGPKLGGRVERPPVPSAAGVEPVGVTAGSAPVGGAAGGNAGAMMSEKTLRIDVEVLNRMMNLVGELVLTRNQILQTTVEAANFPELARRLDSVTADLRGTVMQARMQPVGHVFGKFPRMVRDLALSCGKRVRIEFSGQETGLDKSLLEAIKDPLTHAVRNAVDHGIEEPAVRALAGKQLEGLVCLRAYHHNGSVVIEVQDDGGGIATRRVLAKAIERGLLSEERAAAMTERETLQLIFLAGFSTAAQVTHVSGRGVGMDVVRANIEKVGGTVEVESREGVGTLLRMRVPLTLAIVRALVVRSGGQSFCLPQSSLAELVYVPWREVASSVERIGEAEVYRLRDRLLPMIRLDELLGLTLVEGARQEHGFYLAVLEAEGCHYGLVVDDLMAPEEIVVKPLAPVLREIGLFSGATVLGTGSLAMILDVTAVGVRAGVRPVEQEVLVLSAAPAGASTASTSFLIFENRLGGCAAERMALPLSTVERIEVVAVKEVEYAGGQPLLQYRGELLPLEDGDGILPELLRGEQGAMVTVLICQRPGRGMDVRRGTRLGMVVRRVVEVAEGAPIGDGMEFCAERLALVNDRVTVLHQAFVGPNLHLREVA